MDEVPVRFGDLEWIAPRESRRVVHQAVEATELLLDILKHSLDLGHFLQVRPEQRSAPTLGGGAFGLSCGAVIVNRYARALLRQAQRNASSDPLGSAGHED